MKIKRKQRKITAYIETMQTKRHQNPRKKESLQISRSLKQKEGGYDQTNK